MAMHHIIFPLGDKSKLQVLTLGVASFPEISNYTRAAVQSFDDFDEAEAYAKNLAEKHGKTYTPAPEDEYLDL